MIVYKYYPANEYSINAVREKYFWFSKSVALNDPFDMAGDFFKRFPNFVEKIGLERYVRYRYEELMKNMAICCFSKDSLNKHLWSLYASSYSGFVLGFEDEKFDFSLEDPKMKVLYANCYYENKVPDFNDFSIEIHCPEINASEVTRRIDSLKDELCDGRKLLEKVIEYYLLIKDKTVWEIEQEKRLVLGFDYINQYSSKYDGYKISWPKDSLKEIIWGNKIKSDYKKSIEEHLPADIKKQTVYPGAVGELFALLSW